MQPITIDKRSWHFRFANFINDRGDLPTDSCSYVSWFIKAVIKSIGIAAFAAAIAFVLVFLPLFGIWTLISHGGLYPENDQLREAQIIGLTLAFVYVVFLLYGFAMMAATKTKERYPLAATPFRSLVKDTVWNKICRPVDFK